VRRIVLAVALIVIWVIAGVVVAQITGTFGPGGTIDAFGHSRPFHHEANMASRTNAGIAGGLVGLVVLLLGKLVWTTSPSRFDRALGLTLLGFVTVVLVLTWLFPPSYLGTAQGARVPLA